MGSGGMLHLSVLVTACLLAAPQEGVILHDGREIPGKVLRFADGEVHLRGQDQPIPLHELNVIRLHGGDGDAAEDDPVDFAEGPMVRFRDGETLRARVVEADARRATLRLEGAKGPGSAALTLVVPTDILRGFRLGKALERDDVFEEDIAEESTAWRRPAAGRSPYGNETPAEKEEASTEVATPGDLVYVRRPGSVLRAEGVFEALDDEYLLVNLRGQTRRLRRELVFGLILAPVATRVVETDVPAVLELPGVGELPAFLKGLSADGEDRKLSIRFRGAAPEAIQSVPADCVRQIRFSSDRVVFLSETDPTFVRETPLLGASTAFPWQRDRAASGGALELGGRTYRKGIGVHSRSVLEFDLAGEFSSLAAVVGLDDSAGDEAGVTFRVLADGKQIYEKAFSHGDKPESLSLPVGDVRTLRLEVDYGKDGVDFGDHADWADLRVTR